MSSNSRFGRRIALPSTRQIRHELLTLELAQLNRAKDLAAVRENVPAPTDGRALP